jgi:hypothetical protein
MTEPSTEKGDKTVAQDPGFDVGKAHRYFSAFCFNTAWEFIEKPNRTPDEDEQMICLSQASIWHWTQRNDCISRNLSVGYWQASRVHAIAGRTDGARRYAELCLKHSQKEKPFFLCYAYEALARAEKLAGNAGLATKYRGEAVRLAESVEEADDRKLLTDDLATI